MKKKLKVIMIVLGAIGLSLGCAGNSVETSGKPEQETTQEVAQEVEGQAQSSSTSDISEETNEQSDDLFLNDLAKGLMKRWDYDGKEITSAFGSEEYKEDLEARINAELDHIEKYKNASFRDPELQSLAKSYIDSVEKQLTVLEDYPNRNNFDIKWNTAYEERAAILKQLLENYTVPIDDGYEDIIAEFTNAENTETGDAQQEAALLVVGSKTSQEHGYIDLKVILKNNTDMILCTPTVYVSYLDEAGDILDAVDLQAMVTVFPGQCIALSDSQEAGKASSFVVTTEGRVYVGDESYKVIIGGHLDPISLDSEQEEFEECGKSPINCIDQEVDNTINGTDTGISIEDMYMEENEGDSVECYAKIKNNTSSTIKTPTLHAALMDENGNIIGWDMMQEMVEVNPGQSITVSCYSDEDDLEYFTVTYAAYDVGEEYTSGYLVTIPKAAER